MKGISREQAVSFEAFVKVGGSGDAEEVVFSPETDVTRCVEADFKDAKYPSPPEPSWWVRVEVGLK